MSHYPNDVIHTILFSFLGSFDSHGYGYNFEVHPSRACSGSEHRLTDCQVVDEPRCYSHINWVVHCRKGEINKKNNDSDNESFLLIHRWTRPAKYPS